MNYRKIYDSIINNAKNMTRNKGECYFENHHIIPRCIGGDDSAENMVLLTAKEHFVCHHLLTKIYPKSNKLHSAFWMMLVCESGNQQRYKANSSSYQNAKEKQRDIARARRIKYNKENPRCGELNGMYGSTRFGELNPFFGKKHSDETIQKIKQTKKDNPKIWSEEEKQKLKDSWKNRPIITCPHCSKQSIHASNMRRYHFDNCKSKHQE